MELIKQIMLKCLSLYAKLDYNHNNFQYCRQFLQARVGPMFRFKYL